MHHSGAADSGLFSKSSKTSSEIFNLIFNFLDGGVTELGEIFKKGIFTKFHVLGFPGHV